jgi:hypothetical protein
MEATMGWFTKSDKTAKSDRYEKSRTPGKPGQGFHKGRASSNPNKYKPRTEAQAQRQAREVENWRG